MTPEDQDALSCECIAHNGKHCDKFPLCHGTEGVDCFRVARLEAEVDGLKARIDEAARREAEEPCPVCGYDCAGANPPVSYCPKKDTPPPPAPFVIDHKWLDPECHASGCRTLILKAALEKLRDERDKYMWQVRDTCRRAEAAEAELRIHRERAASVNNMWRHEFSREVEAAADKLFARMAWPHKEIRALAQGGNDG